MPKIEVIEGTLLLTQCTPKEQEKARGIQCRSWNRAKRGWNFPIRPEIIRDLAATFQVEIPTEARALCEDIATREQGVKEVKLAGWENFQETIPMPIKNATPFNHQKLAFSLCCKLLDIN